MRTRRSIRRGLTLVETVAAIVILSLIAGTVLSGTNIVMRSQKRIQYRMGAAELANRLLLQYLDDPDSMPNPSLPVAYGPNRYRWSLAKAPVALAPARTDNLTAQEQQGGLAVDRIEAVTVRVWLSEESGGAFVPAADTPTFAITRMVDPIADAYRNPDSSKNMFATDAGRRRILERFQSTSTGGLVRGGGARPGGQPAGGRPGPTPTNPGTGKPGGKPTDARPGTGKPGEPRPAPGGRPVPGGGRPGGSPGSGGGKGGK
ncbi:MAG TPA: type II secretion system protein [Phycisphaerales bacterium]|nr:type II secretion system protein [Phycisphaerales bacterium]